MVILASIDEFFMLGAYPPGLARLFALRHRLDELVAALDDGIVAIRNLSRAHASFVSAP